MIKSNLTTPIKYGRFWLAIVFATLFVGVNNCMADSTQTFGSVTLYKEVPSSYEVAKKLFPPTTRKIILDRESGTSHVLVQTPEPQGSVAFMVKFAYDSVMIEEESIPYLDALGDMLNFAQLKTKTLQIEGHADASGDSQYNLQLSEARAQSIKRYLQSVHRINPDRLYTIGYGETKLLDRNSPYAEVNRRAEFSPKKTVVN